MYFTFLTGSFTSIESGVKLSREDYENLQSTVNLLEKDLCEAQQNNYFLEEKIKSLEEDYVDNLCLRDWGINPRISDKLKRALAAYEDLCGPEIILTSLKRNYSPGSAHYYGNAADIRFDKKGKAFLE